MTDEDDRWCPARSGKVTVTALENPIPFGLMSWIRMEGYSTVIYKGTRTNAIAFALIAGEYRCTKLTASRLVKLTTAAFPSEYVRARAKSEIPANEAMLMIAPRLAGRLRGRRAEKPPPRSNFR